MVHSQNLDILVTNSVDDAIAVDDFPPIPNSGTILPSLGPSSDML
jgi:hypothetical protein